MRNRWTLYALVGISASLATGCSSPKTPVASTVVTVGNVTASIVPEPNPPVAGDNTLVVDLKENGAVIPDANISATATTQLTGNIGPVSSGRSQGNGEYRVPVRTPVTEQYVVTMTIQRTGKKDVTLKYRLKPV